MAHRSLISLSKQSVLSKIHHKELKINLTFKIISVLIVQGIFSHCKLCRDHLKKKRKKKVLAQTVFKLNSRRSKDWVSNAVLFISCQCPFKEFDKDEDTDPQRYLGCQLPLILMKVRSFSTFLDLGLRAKFYSC